MTNRYLVKIAEQQKQAGISTLAAWHLGQNAIAKKLLHSKAMGKRIADSFQQGIKGTHEGSVKRKLTSVATSIAAPEMEAAYRKANQLGQTLGPGLSQLSPRAKVSLRQLSEGRFHDFAKLKHRAGLDANATATISSAAGAMEKFTKAPVKSLMSAPKSVQLDAQKHWNSKDHPLLSNITAQLSRGNANATKAVHKPMRQSTPLVSQAVTALVDAPGAAANAIKASTIIDKVKNSKVAGPAIKKVEDYFTTHQAKLGAGSPGVNKFKGGVKNLFQENVVNPVSASIKNTSATMSAITHRGKLAERVQSIVNSDRLKNSVADKL